MKTWLWESSPEHIGTKSLDKIEIEYDRIEEILSKLQHIRKHQFMFSTTCSFFHSNYYIASDVYVPQQIIDKFEEVTALTLENGLFQFYNSLELFWFNIWGFVITTALDRHEFKFEPIQLSEFYYPLLIYFLTLLAITLLFLLEMICAKCQKRLAHFYSRIVTAAKNIRK